MALDLTAIAPEIVSCVGGDLIVFNGTFSIGTPYTGRIGSLTCTSGIPGQANVLYSYDGSTLTAYVPTLRANTIYDVAVHDAQGSIVFLVGALKADADFYLTEIFSLRSILPSNYALGPRAFFDLPNVVSQ